MSLRKTIIAGIKQSPVVEIDNQAEAVYVRFQRGKKVAKTVVRCNWPHVAIDLDRADNVIGVEAVGVNEFTITAILHKAHVEAPKSLLARARYIPTKRARFVPAAA